VRITARAVEPQPRDEPGVADTLRLRKLHAKVAILQGTATTLAYVGSANFTTPGWGFTRNGLGANVESGVVLVRRGGALAAALLPPTTGKPVEIDARTMGLGPVAEEPEQPVPTFILGVWLEPDPADPYRVLRLSVRIDPSRVRGPFEVASTGEDRVVLLEGGEGSAEETHVRLDPGAVERLLREQEVSIGWWESTEPRGYPVNVELAARAQLPAVPGCPNPGEKLLLAYYQGRISATDLFPPPRGWEDPTDPLPEPGTEVDTWRIRSYQVREFVEALQGIRDDLAAASKGTTAAMRLAVLGPVSPVALARQVLNGAVTRGATAAGFELVEVASCLREATLIEGARREWRGFLDEGQRAIESMLDEVVRISPEELGPKTAFARYAREVLGWRSKGGQAA
jgi:hypothetical protein